MGLDTGVFATQSYLVAEIVDGARKGSIQGLDILAVDETVPELGVELGVGGAGARPGLRGAVFTREGAFVAGFDLAITQDVVGVVDAEVPVVGLDMGRLPLVGVGRGGIGKDFFLLIDGLGIPAPGVVGTQEVDFMLFAEFVDVT